MRVVQGIYEDSEKAVKCGVGVTDGFKVGWDYMRDQL